LRPNYPTMKQIIGVCQMSVDENIDQNLQQARDLVSECNSRGAVFVFLPEACDYISSDRSKSVKMSNFLDSDLFKEYSKMAAEFGVWLSCGGIHRRCADDPGDKMRNSHVVFDADGVVRLVYDKCHLFNVDIPNKVRLQETDTVVAGKSIVEPIDTPIGKLGAMVCYDVRFPQISSKLREKGAEILTYPSAFTVPTGHAHWEALLRARAIENQCYVVAAAQVGVHNSSRKSYGHSMIVDPWGTVLACAGDRVGVITAEIELDYLWKLRQEMPVSSHMRHDLY
uniref:Deaminated glutathione amidase n=1 Tax=Ciona savignyi TaxID=51511 RepID=H2YQ19_CIOSA